MRPEIADELEEFIRRGKLWSADELTALIDLLEHESAACGDSVAGLLCTPLKALLVRLRMGALPPTTAADVEAVVYPRLWKVIEAARDDLPDAELRTRIEVLNRRLARIFADEAPRLS